MEVGINLGKAGIKTIEISGWLGALKGMRNPLNSWNKADTIYENGYAPIIGENDMRLAKNLIKGGPEHRKFLRMIHVQADFTFPRAILQELDTYKIATVCNSCSTMHKLLDNVNTSSFALDDFVYFDEDKEDLEKIIFKLNYLRAEYKAAKERKYVALMNRLLKRAKLILPEGYLLPRTMDLNYETIRTIYHQRKNHRFDDIWNDIFCKWVETLPYSKEFITDGE